MTQGNSKILVLVRVLIRQVMWKRTSHLAMQVGNIIDRNFIYASVYFFHNSKVRCSELLVRHLNLHFQSRKDFIYVILSQSDDSKKSKNSFLSQIVFFNCQKQLSEVFR